MKEETLEKLRVFIDDLEEEFGHLEGFEVKLEHPIIEGERQEFANIKEFVVYYIHKAEIDLSKKK